MSFHAIATLQILRRVNEIDDHINAFSLDSECRDLCEPRRFHKPHLGVQRMIPAPTIEKNGRSGPDADGVRGENVGDNFDLRGVA